VTALRGDISRDILLRRSYTVLNVRRSVAIRKDTDACDLR
jgi:hypothetical protein